MANRKSFWVATLETRHFNFSAYGETASDARTALRATWQAHRREFRGRNVAPWSDFKDDVCVREFALGAGYRDGEMIFSPKNETDRSA